MKSRLPALVAVLLAVLAGTACWYAVRATPGPVAADGASSAFSAVRAKTHIEEIARSPHPSGSPAAAEVRAYITSRLGDLGLRPEAREATEVLPGEGGWAHLAGRVHNITATVPGRQPTGRVLLVAHTDSVATSPGASDNGLGVASLLEIARALQESPRQRNDVVLLFTDAEEIGQLGARAFIRGMDTDDRARDVVVNLDARGTRGRAIMFETGERSFGVVRALGRTPPVATSLSDEIYRLLPNQTDFTPFRDAGLTGLNFAVAGGSARYHGPQDDVDHVELGSLQDLGATVLSATRHLASEDLGEVADAPEATWFTVGTVLVRYPAWAVLPLAVAALAAVAAAMWCARRRRALRPGAAGFAAAVFPLPLVTAAGLGWAAWQVLLLVKPAYGRFHHGDPYRTGLPVAGLLLVVAATTWLWGLWVRRRATPLETGAAVLSWLALLALLTAALVPGASYAFTWTALGGAAGLAAAARLPEGSPWRPAATGAAALPAVVLFVPLVALFFPVLGLAAAAVPLVPAAMVAALLALPLLGAFGPPGRPDRAERLSDRPERPGRPGARAALAGGAALALLGTALVAVGAATDRTDAEHPLPVSLVYVRDVDRQRASWVSGDAGTDPWVTHHTGTGRTAAFGERFPFLPAPPGGHLAGTAPPTGTAVPAARVLADERRGDTRRLRLSVTVDNGAPVLVGMYVDTSTTEVVEATVAGAPPGTAALAGGVNQPGTASPWKWGLVFAAPPEEGFEMTLTVRGRGPVRLLAMAQEPGLPKGAPARPLPADRTWAAEGAGLSMTARTHTW